MRKVAAILLITVYLVNLAGGAMLFEYLIQKNDRLLTERIDEGDYDLSQLVEVKVPLRLHYYSSSLNYERYYGEAEVDGRYYSYVMRKVMNDTVYLLCLPNTVKAELKKAKIDAGLLAADFGGTDHPSKAKGNAGKKQLSLTECFGQYILYESMNCWYKAAALSCWGAEPVVKGFMQDSEKPPKFENRYCTKSHYGLRVLRHTIENVQLSYSHSIRIQAMT